MNKRTRILMIAACLMAFNILGFSQSNVSSKTNQLPTKSEVSPTLQETLDYLKEKLSENNSVKLLEVESQAMTVAFDEFNFSSCGVSWRSAITISNLPPKLTVTSFNLKYLTGIDLKESPYKGAYEMRLNTETDRVKDEFIGRAGTPRNVKQKSVAAFFFRDKLAADKISKAFLHASELCRSQKEIF
jgi:hypothetical protein